jgi:hippurate hydrolase
MPTFPAFSVRLALLLLASYGATSLPAQVPAAFQKRLDEDFPHLEALYRHLHQNPELSVHEEQTAARIAVELRAAGLEVTEKVGGHGVVGVLRNGDGPVVLLRSDLDALPIREETGLPFASRAVTRDDAGNEVGVMHACGHDMHMTVLVGAAHALAHLKAEWRGTLVCIGQPAEERGGGASAMLRDGLFERFPRPAACLALHVSSTHPAGSIGWTEGFALANVDSVDITFRGVGGHGAYPHTTRDPIVLAAQAILTFQTIVSRETMPGEPAVVTVGSIHGGTKHNIIPDDVKLQLTLRSYSEDVRASTIASIRRICAGLADAAGIPRERAPEVKVGEGLNALHNDPALTKRARGAIAAWLGEDRLLQARPVMGGEDFSEYGRTAHKIPVAMLWLGAVAPEKVKESERTKKPLPSLHTSTFHPVLEPTLRTGVTALTAAALELLGKAR